MACERTMLSFSRVAVNVMFAHLLLDDVYSVRTGRECWHKETWVFNTTFKTKPDSLTLSDSLRLSPTLSDSLRLCLTLSDSR